MMREDEKAGRGERQSDDSAPRSSLPRLFAVILIIFASELAVMWALPHLIRHTGSLWGAVVDAALLGLITGPFLWWLVVRPLDVVARLERTRAARIIGGANDAIITVDGSGRIESANTAVETIFGRAPRDVRGRDISCLLPESAGRVRAVLEEGREARLRLREPHREGRRLHLEVDAFPVPMPGRTVLAFVVRDVTLRHHRELALRLTRFAVQRAADAVFFVRHDGTILYVNDAAARSLGYERSRLLRLNVESIAPEWSPALWARHWEDVKRLGSLTRELKHRRSDGVLFPVETASNIVEGDGFELVCVYARDIRERRQSEETQRLLATAIEQASETVVVTDPRGTLLYVNPAFERITGYRRDEALGRASSLVRSGRHDPAFYAGLWSTITRGEVWKGRFVNRRKDGTEYQEDATISPVRDPSGRITAYVAVKRDITHEATLEEQLRHAQKMDAIGRVAGGVAHDFNNMLAVVLGNCELILQDLPADAPTREHAREIMLAVDRSAALTRRILAFSRKGPADAKVLDLNETVTSTCRMLQRLIGEAIEVRLVLAPSIASVRADAGHLEQVLVNLAVNARDAMPEGGRLTLETADAGVIDGADGTRRRHVLLAVRDTGCGMDAATKARLFEPFFTTKEAGKGTGLGLSTVLGIVRESGGQIQVDSELGQGTSVIIRLPAVTAKEKAGTPALGDPARGTETVLLVEDDSRLRRIARAFLEDGGYAVLEAATPSEAIELEREHEGAVDLLVSDLLLPEMDGTALARILTGNRPEMRTLFVSGYADGVLDAPHTGAGRPEVLAKPFGRREFLERVRHVLDGAAAHMPAE